MQLRSARSAENPSHLACTWATPTPQDPLTSPSTLRPSRSRIPGARDRAELLRDPQDQHPSAAVILAITFHRLGTVILGLPL